MKYAKKEIKEEIIRCDQLIEYIKKIINQADKASCKDEELYEKLNKHYGIDVLEEYMNLAQ
jgi:hypothetical protein